MHDAAYRVRLPLDQQAHVIGTSSNRRKERTVIGSSGFRGARGFSDSHHRIEDRLAVIAARNDVIKATLDFNSSLPAMAGGFYFFDLAASGKSQIAGLTPFLTNRT